MSLVFKAQQRVEFGSKAAKNARKAGNILVTIYSKPKNIDLLVDTIAFEKEYFKGNLPATIIEFEYDSKKIKAIAHDIIVDPVTDRPIQVDFIECNSTDNSRAKPKFNFEGKEKSPGLKRGGFLNVALRRADISCSAKIDIPTEININVSSMHIADKVRAHDIKLPEGIQFLNKRNFLVCSITGRGKSATAEDSAEEGADKAAAEASKDKK